MARTTIAYIPTSHMDLFWLGSYKSCLERGAQVIKQYIDRVLATPDETFLLETTVFADYFVKRYPEYRDILIRLVGEGRVEVGTAFIDRWEHLVLGESQVRNIQFGKQWCREVLGIDNRLTTHPDLPGLVPQTAQLYAQAGVDFYVTSRKMYEQGAIWRHQSPDGSTLLFLNYPRHYTYVAVTTETPNEEVDWWDRQINVDTTLKGFPLGTILIAGSASDLTDRETFRNRYGAYLEDLVEANRQRFPQFDFSYAIPSQVLEPYRDLPDLPIHQGEVPSVWGVAADEEVAFFRRDRQIESLLLTSETLAVIAQQLGLSWLPASSSEWQGTFYESAFYAAKDPIASGQELSELWRMHVFTQDHNGGGYEGILSSFQKRVIQERLLAYTGEIIDHTGTEIGSRLALSGDAALVLNPDGQPWSGILPVILPLDRWQAGERLLDATGQALPAQLEAQDGQSATVSVLFDSVPAVGYQAFALGQAAQSRSVGALQLVENSDVITLTSDAFILSIDRTTGALTRIFDRQREREWGNPTVGQIRAYHEIGSDVTLRLNHQATPISEQLERIELGAQGPLSLQLHIYKRLLDAAVVQTVTLWAHTGQIDFETRIRWWGAHNLQLRMGLPSAATDAIAYGTPFYGSGWNDIIPGSAPRNPDEVLLEDYPHYREVQNWLHLDGQQGGLAIITNHPGFYHDEQGLQAVLMRTSPSCGDKRLFWENAGEQVYRFTLLAAEADWHAADTLRCAVQRLRPPVVRLVQPDGSGDLPAAQSLLQVSGPSVQLAALYPAQSAGAVVARIYETAGNRQMVDLSGPIASAPASAVNLLEEQAASLPPTATGTALALTPWRIQTILFAKG